MYQHSISTALYRRRITLAAFSLVWGLIISLANAPVSHGQTLGEPRKERTLNGLQVLISNSPSAPDVMLKLRVHSGSVFDLAGKAGTMVLLSDILFPDPNTREYVSEELGGQLKTEANLDFLEVTLSGRPQEFERLVELLRTALVSTPLDNETVARVKAERERLVKSSTPSAADRADAAIRARLYGDFPYGRPAEGTLESRARIDRADLMFARERFLNPNNATLVVAGNVQPDRVMRTLRQLLGGWRKSDTTVPATFRQPSVPDERLLVVEPAGNSNVELRYAVRGSGRGKRDELTTRLIANILQSRLRSRAQGTPFTVTSDAHLLSGELIISASVPYTGLKSTLSLIRSEVSALSKTAPTADEVINAKASVKALMNARLASTEQTAETWLDSITYKAPPFKEQLAQLDQISGADVQALSARLFSPPAGLIAVGDGDAIAKELGPGEKLQRNTAEMSTTPAVNPK